MSDEFHKRRAGESMESMMARIRKMKAEESGEEPTQEQAPAQPTEQQQPERQAGDEIIDTIMAPEGMGDHQIQIISTNHIEYYLSLPRFVARSISRDILVSKMTEAAEKAYAHWATIKRNYQGIASSQSTDLNIVFIFEAHDTDDNIMEFVMKTAMIKKNFESRQEGDVMFKISKKAIVYDGNRCSEIARNIYASNATFGEQNVNGLLQDVVAQDVEGKRSSWAIGFGGLETTHDKLASYTLEVDVNGNVIVAKAWWKGPWRFEKVALG